MIYILINAIPILAAAIIGVVICALWFRKPIPPGTGVILFVAHAWLAAILAGALILAPPKGSVWIMTIGSAFVIWIGFVLPAFAASYKLRKLPWSMVAIDAGYWLVSMLAQAALMRLIGLTAPPV